jgi:hypothetical protein
MLPLPRDEFRRVLSEDNRAPLSFSRGASFSNRVAERLRRDRPTHRRWRGCGLLQIFQLSHDWNGSSKQGRAGRMRTRCLLRHRGRGRARFARPTRRSTDIPAGRASDDSRVKAAEVARSPARLEWGRQRATTCVAEVQSEQAARFYHRIAGSAASAALAQTQNRDEDWDDLDDVEAG